MHFPASLFRANPKALALLDVLSKLPYVPCRHALGHADEVRRRCLVNQESAVRVARDLGVDPKQVCGAVRILKYGQFSPERLALVVMKDWGMADEDIAEIFSRSVRWAQVVRSQADEIRAEEPMPAWMEYVDCGLQEGDPSPEEIVRRAKEARGLGWTPVRPDSYRPAIRSFQWRGDRAAFVSVGVA